jgi:hypothetical protein
MAGNLVLSERLDSGVHLITLNRPCVDLAHLLFLATRLRWRVELQHFVPPLYWRVSAAATSILSFCPYVPSVIECWHTTAGATTGIA